MLGHLQLENSGATKEEPYQVVRPHRRQQDSDCDVPGPNQWASRWLSPLQVTLMQGQFYSLCLWVRFGPQDDLV